ncbi:hypothetical protein BT96DRAFT_941147 [Gymnopus androsaceus JB14]|uniref:Uncharacterized protein n=1 Tax=Gymnopus androsaceus JB14 TaxID=1447944 RepID=A0A6A4HHT2_9AGAR|nr:hypothetical protein BT96DRAFT_941147 [Gymnopus androsaceus JB14]
MDFLSSTNSTPELDLRCWNILRVYSTTNIGAGEVEEQLSGVFQNSGYKYEEARWAPRMGRIMGTETDDIKGNMANLQWIDDEISGLSMAMFTARSPAGPTPESPSASAPSPPSHESPLSSSVSTKVRTLLKEYTARKRMQCEAGMEGDLIPAKRLQLEAGMAVDPIPEPVLSPSTQNSVLPLSSSSGKDSVLLSMSPPLPQNATPSSGVKTTSTTASSDGADTPLISLRSFDGRVATLFQNIGLFVTTPNMDVIHSPITCCETCMQKFNNFAKDDPLYWPQLYHAVVAHLAVLPCPNDSADHPLRWAWYQPTSADFEPVSFPGLTGMVCLAQSLQSQITSMCTTFSETIAKLPQEQLRDAYLTRGRNQLRKYIEHLSEPRAQNIVSLQLTCLQRVFLESYAHSQWLEKWVLHLHDVDTSFELDPHVMGAFTEDLSTAADLFRMGIPVWLVRRFEHRALTKIQRFVAALDEQLWNHTLPLRDSDAPLNIAHEDPPHPLIYTTIRLITHWDILNRGYGHSKYLVGQDEKPGSFYNTFSSEGFWRSSQIICFAGDAIIKSPVLENKPVPDKQKTGKLPRGPLHEERNRFLPVTHECFPVRVHLWDEASRRLAELQRYTGPSLLEHYLPDPSLFVNPNNLLKPALIVSWLRIRPVILWRLGLPDPKDWRAMLEAADNFLVSGSKKRGEMLEILKALVKESHSSGIVINEHNLSGMPAYWKGQLVQCNASGSLDPQIVWEVVWVLYEAKFRLEIRTLDRYIVPQPEGDSEEVEMLRESWFARELEIDRCWPGLAHCPRSTQPGFSTHSNEPLRIRYLKGLFNLVKGWPGEKPDELRKAFPKEEDIVRMHEVEEALANYYALDIPCMPNCVNNWAELPFQTSKEKYNSKSAGEEGLLTLKNIMKCFDLENTVTYMVQTARLNVAGLRMVISDNALSHWSFFEMKGICCRAHLANLAADDWLRHALGENSQSDYEITEVD